MENTCRNCGGELIEKNSYYECDCCGKRFPKEDSAPKNPAKKEQPKSEDDELITQLWRLSSAGSCCIVNSVEKGDDTLEAIRYFGENVFNALEDIRKFDTLEKRKTACSEFAADFIGNVMYLYHRNIDYVETLLPKRGVAVTDAEVKHDFEKLKVALKKQDEREQALFGCVLSVMKKIYERTDAFFTKMVYERLYEVVATLRGNKSQEAEREAFLSKIDSEVLPYAKKLAEEYWSTHRSVQEIYLQKIASLEKEKKALDKLLDDAINERDRKTKEAEKAVAEAQKKYDDVTTSLYKLNFFQRKEKQRLLKESEILLVEKKNLEFKVKTVKGVGQKKVNEVLEKTNPRDSEIRTELEKLKKELGRIHFPGEEAFVVAVNEEKLKARARLNR